MHACSSLWDLFSSIFLGHWLGFVRVDKYKCLRVYSHCATMMMGVRGKNYFNESHLINCGILNPLHFLHVLCGKVALDAAVSLSACLTEIIY